MDAGASQNINGFRGEDRLRASTRLACILMAFAMTASMAAVALSPPSGAVGANAMDKFEPELRTQLLGAMKSGQTASFTTVVFITDDADIDSVGRAMVKAGASVKERFSALGALAVEMDSRSAMGVAALDQVEKIFLDEKKYRLLDDKNEQAYTYATLGIGKLDATEATNTWWASTSAEMGAEDVWEKGIKGYGVTVAVLDTGCDITQNDLKDAIKSYRSFTSEEFHDVDGHGTATAGLVASRGLNDYVVSVYDGVVKMMGMAPAAKLMTGKVLDDTGYGWDTWIIGGIEWAITGDDGVAGTADDAQIISMSLGGMEVPNDGNDPTSYALDIAADEYGIASFLSAGNEGTGQSTVGCSGVSKNTMTVGASTLNAECQLLKYWPLSDYYEQYLIVKEGEKGYENDHMIWFSSRGPSADGRIDPDICAAGAWGPSTQPGDTIEMQFGGTSMAAPVAAGVGALIYEAYLVKHGIAPTPDQLREIIMGTALDMGYEPNEQGPGRIDALAAYSAVENDWQAPGPSSVALTIDAGSYANTEFADGTVLGSKTYVPSGREDMTFSGTSLDGEDLFYEFPVEDGEDYITIDLAFDQEYVFTRDVHELTSSGGYTDTHINIILYRLDENGERTMINYAYAHTNTQELNARVTPGDYELRVSPVMYRTLSVPFDVGIRFFSLTTWDWFSTADSIATIEVPSDATPGVHTGFIQASYDGVDSLVPVAISVPIKIGAAFEDVIDVNHEVWGFNEGDWKYYFVEVPEDETPTALTSVIDWSSWNTDIDTYWINPDREVVDASITNYIKDGIFGPWETSTGDTADILTVLDPEPGMWMLAFHVVMMDRVLEEPYTVTVTPMTAAQFEADRICVKPGTSMTTNLLNNMEYAVGVGLMPVMDTVVSATYTFVDWVSSIDQHGKGASSELFTVQPGTLSMTASIEWTDENADLDVVIYAADWSNRGILWESGDSIVVDDPVPGEWEFVVALKNSANHVSYTLTITTTAYQPWTALTLSSYAIWLQPGESVPVTLTLTATMGNCKGMILAYDLVTGCEYDSLQVNGKML